MCSVHLLGYRIGGYIIVYVSLRRRVRRTLYDLYIQYFLPEEMVKFTIKAKRQFVALLEIGIHLAVLDVS